MIACRQLVFLFIILGCTLLPFRARMGQYLAVPGADIKKCAEDVDWNDYDEETRRDRILPPIAHQFTLNYNATHQQPFHAEPQSNRKANMTHYCVVTKNSMWPGVNFNRARTLLGLVSIGPTQCRSRLGLLVLVSTSWGN